MISKRTSYNLTGRNKHIVFWSIFAVLPLVAGLVYSLLYSFGIIGLLSDGFTLAHWQAVLSGKEFFFSLAFTAYITLASIFLSGCAALLLSFVFVKAYGTGNPPFWLYVPFSMPAVVAAFYVFIVLGKTGPLSSLAHSIGISSSFTGFPDLINDTYGIGIITTHCLLAIPFLTVYFYSVAGTYQIHKLEHLASTLGANRFDYFRSIFAPLILRKSTSTLLLYSIFVFGSYEIPLLLGREFPKMISVLIIQKFRRFNILEIPEGYVMIVLVAGIVLSSVYMFFKKGVLKNEY